MNCGCDLSSVAAVTPTDWARRSRERLAGHVKWFNNEKGYGFISPDGGGKDLFVHFSRIVGPGYRALDEGAQVWYTHHAGEKGPEAMEIITARPREPRVQSDGDLEDGPVEQFALLLNEDGSISFVPLATAGLDAVATASSELHAVLLAGLRRFRQLALADEFEELLNMRGLSEHDVQEFLTAHQEFLVGVEYEEALPQVILPLEDRYSLRPDFVLKPIAGVSWDAQVVELKLPTERILRRGPVHREGIYSTVTDAIRQLRAYGRYFEDEAHKSAMAAKLGFRIERPRLALVIGRRQQLPSYEKLAALAAEIAPVNLITYDDLIIRYRQMLQR